MPVTMIIRRILIGSAIITGSSVALLAYKILRCRRSRSHNVFTTFKHYISNCFIVLLGRVSFHTLMDDSKNIRETQEKLLMEIVTMNKDTDYGKDYRLDKVHNISDFRRYHPLTHYNHYKDYVLRVTENQEDSLCWTKKKPVVMALTSGTSSGQCAYLPTTEDIWSTFFFSGVSLMSYKISCDVPHWLSLQKTMKIFFPPSERKTHSGIPIGPNSSNPTNSKHLYYLYSTPQVAWKIQTEPEMIYIHLLFGLKDGNLGMIEANFINVVLTAFGVLELKHKSLISDIRYGRLSPDIKISPDTRKSIEKLLKPDEERATDLEIIFSSGSSFNKLAKMIWPNLNAIVAVTSGSMEVYANLLKAKYCNGVPLFSPFYAASEGLLGVNLHPLKTDDFPLYTLAPRAQFFEFVPIQESHLEAPRTFLLDEVKDGNLYELVVTNPSGLYRYRLGDVVKVKYHLNQLPVIQFSHRIGQMLNVRGEKIPEDVFYDALSFTVNTLGLQLCDFAVAESSVVGKLSTSGVPYYMVFLEVVSKDVSEVDLAEILDARLCEIHGVYKSFRKKSSIDSIQTFFVENESFESLRELILTTTEAERTQLKLPKVLRRQDLVQFLTDSRQL